MANAIIVIGNEELKELESLSGKNLPNRPGDKGWSADQIRRILYEGSTYLFNLLKDLEEKLHYYFDGDGEDYVGILETIETLKEDVLQIQNGHWTIEQARKDQLGRVFENTYATIEALQTGALGVLKYIKADGSLANIRDVLSEVESNLHNYTTWVATYFSNGKANGAILSERSVADQQGRVIHDTYATKEEASAKETNAKNYADNYFVKKSQVKNVLTDTSTDLPLSAYQGKVLKGLIDSIQTLLASNDTDLDTIQEIVTYIKNNKSLIDGITTNKVNVSDIVDNLTSEISNKPASAKQVYILKGLIDDIVSGVTKVKKAEVADKVGETTEAQIVKSINGITPTSGNVNVAGFVSFVTYEDGDDLKLKAIYQGDIGGTFSLVDDGDYKYLVFTPTGA